MHQTVRQTIFSSLLAFAALSPAMAQVDPKAKAVLDEVAKTYKNINALHEKVTFVTEAKNAPTEEGRDPVSLEIKYLRPNKLMVEFQRKGPGGKAMRDITVSDGANLWRYTAESHTQSKTKAPSTHIGIIKLPDATPECDLLFRAFDPFQLFSMGAKVTLATPEKLNEVDVDAIIINIDTGVAQGSATIKMLIGQKDHLIKFIQYDVVAKEPMTGKDITYKVSMKYDIANGAPMFTDADFKFIAPTGAKTIQPGTIEVKPGSGVKP